MQVFLNGAQWVLSLCFQVFVMVGLPLGIYLTIRRIIRAEVNRAMDRKVKQDQNRG